MSRQEQIDMYMKYMDIVKREGKDEFIKWLIDDTVLSIKKSYFSKMAQHR
jgi:hypothetical protein